MVPRAAALAIVAVLLASSRAATQERVPVDAPAPADRVIGLTKPADVRVEWLELVAQEGVRVIASREYTAVNRLSLAVPAHPVTYLRFFRGTSSPITILGNALPTTPGATLPPVMPGGELFVTIEPATVTPELFHIGGTSITIKPEKDPAFSLLGLADGRYTIKPVYVGGRAGAEIGVVRGGKTTDVVVRKEAVGAASIAAEGLRCQFMDGIRVWQEDGQKKVTEETTYPTDPSTCAWRIEGLPVGWYMVSAMARGGRGSIMMVEIVEQKTTNVAIAEPTVRVTGRITFDAVPLADTPITLSTSMERPIDARTDANGEFAAALPVSGKYSLGIRSAELQQFREAILQVGDNYVDWAIAKGGTLRISTEGFDPGAKMMIMIQSRDKGRRFMTMRPLSAGEDLTLTALPFGTYTVVASQPGRMTTTTVVTLDARRDTQDIKVTPQ